MSFIGGESEEEKRIINNIRLAIKDLYRHMHKENEVPPVLYTYLDEFKNCKYEMITLGNTKAGKSSLLNEIIGGAI